MKTIDFLSAQNVKVEYELASPFQRVAGAMLDGVFLGTYILLILLFLFNVAEVEGSKFLIVELIFIKIPWIFYYPISEYFGKGQTLGKTIVGTRVVTYNGERPGLREIFTRWIFKGYFFWIGTSFSYFFKGASEVFQFGAIQFCIGLVGFIFVALSDKKQRLGDAMAGTLIIRTKPSRNYTLRSVLSIKTEQNYEVKYPEAIRFTDDDMLLIKNTIKRVRTNPNKKTKDFTIELADKAAELIGLDETPEKRLQFLNTLLKDYVVLTR